MTKQITERETTVTAPRYVTAIDSKNWESIEVDTPSVSNRNFFTIHSSFTGGTITNFLQGQDTQQINILGDGSTIIEDNTFIKRPGGTLALDADRIYRFTLFIDPSSSVHIWYEDS